MESLTGGKSIVATVVHNASDPDALTAPVSLGILRAFSP